MNSLFIKTNRPRHLGEMPGLCVPNVPPIGPLGLFWADFRAQRPNQWTVRTPGGPYGVPVAEKTTRGHETLVWVSRQHKKHRADTILRFGCPPVHRGAAFRAREADSGCPVHRGAAFRARKAESKGFRSEASGAERRVGV